MKTILKRASVKEKEFLTAYSNKLQVTTDFDPINQPSLTKREFQDECDINNVVQRYSRANQQLQELRFTDEVQDMSQLTFHESSLIIAKARSTFESLPNKIRAHFNHSVEKYLDAHSSVEGMKKLNEFGILHIPTENETHITDIPDDKPDNTKIKESE